MTDGVRQTPADEVDGEEGWDRLTDEPELRDVEAIKLGGEEEWPWQVVVSVAEFLRDEPLESELNNGMERALRSVPGVENVIHEDREVWAVSGSPSGKQLVGAAAAVVDELAPRAREYMESLGG